MTTPQYKFMLGDALKTGLPDQSVDLVFTSPPYESQRTYGIGFNLRGEEFVAWVVAAFKEALRICRGLVCFVLEGFTADYRWSATPALVMADLHRAGICLRKPPVYHRIGIPGSGGPDWLRADTEWIICATNGGKLPWSCNTAMGNIPAYAPGGSMSNRTPNGARINDPWGKRGRGNSLSGRRRDGSKKLGSNADRDRITMTREREGIHAQTQGYTPPKLANPGNVIKEKYSTKDVAAILQQHGDISKHIVGGGLMGHELSHNNEAPFPETLANFFIRSFCPPGGTVLDPFIGSGTTAAAAVKAGRNCIGIDCRWSQIKICERRLREVCQALQVEAVA